MSLHAVRVAVGRRLANPNGRSRVVLSRVGESGRPAIQVFAWGG